VIEAAKITLTLRSEALNYGSERVDSTKQNGVHQDAARCRSARMPTR